MKLETLQAKLSPFWKDTGKAKRSHLRYYTRSGRLVGPVIQIVLSDEGYVIGVYIVRKKHFSVLVKDEDMHILGVTGMLKGKTLHNVLDNFQVCASIIKANPKCFVTPAMKALINQINKNNESSI